MFKKGQKKIGGRTKDTPNLKKTVEDICSSEGCCPISVMVRICMKDGDQYQFSAAKELASYLYPKQTAMTLSGPNGGPIETEAQSSLMNSFVAKYEEKLESLERETKCLQSSSKKREP